MEQETSTVRPEERTRDRARQTAAVLCLVAGVVHLLGGRFLVMIFGVGYCIAALALFRRWRNARAIATTFAALRAVGTLVLLGLKVPELFAASMTPEVRMEAGRDLYWIVVNVGILLLMVQAGAHQTQGGARDGAG